MPYNIFVCRERTEEVEDRMPKQAFTDSERSELVGIAKAEGIDRSNADNAANGHFLRFIFVGSGF